MSFSCTKKYVLLSIAAVVLFFCVFLGHILRSNPHTPNPLEYDAGQADSASYEGSEVMTLESLPDSLGDAEGEIVASAEELDYDPIQGDLASYEGSEDMIEDFFPDGLGDTEEEIEASSRRFAEYWSEIFKNDEKDWRTRVQFYNGCFCVAYNYGLNRAGIDDKELITLLGSVKLHGKDAYPELARAFNDSIPYIGVCDLKVHDDSMEIEYVQTRQIFDKEAAMALRP